MITMIKLLSFDTQLFHHSLISIALMVDVALNYYDSNLTSIDIVFGYF